MGGCSGECACTDAIPARSLYASIDINGVTGINEQVRGCCREVVKKSHAERNGGVVAVAKDGQRLIVKIPFISKVALSRIEIKSSFKQLCVFANNRYVTLSSKPKPGESYCLPGDDHIIRVNLPSYKYKSVDFVALYLQDAGEGEGTLSYLCLCGEVTGSLAKAVNVSYELYPIPEDTKISEKSHSTILQ
ncbi:hypothetical protein NEHOM01_1659 [Nematocida homosporus]|uniref:uncharacterized protein n=1 Tax=Nematocida homosporus TaxID=1912981 RepID=UPI0022204F03|nr:uncharacterized protein NEHOM01_1659 [Nematocida homosporus]KAI5186720.1 hypothetical protein NEHOM01_1659 [Nematocida homosporus]